MSELAEKLSKFDALLREQAIKTTCKELEEEFINSVLESWGFTSS